MKFERIEILDGIPALYIDARIPHEDIQQQGLYAYDLRSGDYEYYASLEPLVVVNHTGTVITKEPIDFGEDGRIPLDDDTNPNFLGYEMTLAEFLSAPVGISVADAIAAARKQFAWNPVKGEPFSAKVIFLNLDGEEDETQLDLYSDTPEQELEELWASLAEEMGSTADGIISVEAVPIQD